MSCPEDVIEGETLSACWGLQLIAGLTNGAAVAEFRLGLLSASLCANNKAPEGFIWMANPDSSPLQ
jgi:hypothetical protein